MSEIKKDTLDIVLVPCLSDNYAYLLIDKKDGVVAVVDPSEPQPVISALQQRNIKKLDYILNTHHHFDHTGGNIDLKKQYQCQIIGPKADKSRIPGIDIALDDQEEYQIGGQKIIGYNTPGHTLGHICYYLPLAKSVFTGDHLFYLGCGRAFEGSYEQFWNSLSKIRSLPEDTEVYCGHEYTQSNAKFAASVLPKNEALQKITQQITELRSKKLPTIPSTIGKEKAANPFLRPEDKELLQNLGLSGGLDNSKVFGAVRKAKDVF